MSENTTISKGLRYTFLIHFIVGILIGLLYLISPDTYADLFNFTIQEPMYFRIIGAAILSFAIASLLAYKETEWANVKIIVMMEIIWTALAAIVSLWGVISEEFPPAAWLNVILMVLFAGAFTYFYKIHRSN